MTDTITDGSVTEAEVPVQDTTEATDNTQNSNASEQQVETPEATQTNEGEQSEVKAEDTVKDKLLAGKYKSVEDLEKSYKELESKYGKESSEKAELTRILTDAFTSTDSQTGSQQGDDSTYDQTSYDGYETDLNNETEKLKQDNAVIKFMISHNDVNGDAMQEVLAKDPLISQINGYEAKLEYAYLRSQNMTQSKAIAEAEKKAATKAESKVIEKQSAQVESSSNTEAVDENVELRNKATGNYSPTERKEARMSVLKKILTE